MAWIIASALHHVDVLNRDRAAVAVEDHEDGEADGRLGAMTRTAVKQAQLKVGLPADAYPTAQLIERLKAAR